VSYSLNEGFSSVFSGDVAANYAAATIVLSDLDTPLGEGAEMMKMNPLLRATLQSGSKGWLQKQIETKKDIE